MRDSVIIEMILADDEKGMNYLYKANNQMLTKIILKNSGTNEEAKDVVQDALIIFWKKIKANELVMTSRISTYLHSVCWNLWRKQLERKSRLINEEVDSEIIIDYDKKERIEAIRGAVNCLGDVCRRVMSYYYFDGLTMNEIAEKMGYCSSDVSKTKRYKCFIELQNLVKSTYSENDFLD